MPLALAKAIAAKLGVRLDLAEIMADESVDDDVCDGTRLDRWLAGQIDALDLVYDHDGEFAEDVFDEDGELLPIIREKQLRAQLKRLRLSASCSGLSSRKPNS